MKTSEQTADLFKALAQFRLVLKQPLKDAANPFFKSAYVPLENIVTVIDEAMIDTGLNYMQEDDEGYIYTIITHESGQWMKLRGAQIKATKNDAQGLGSGISYAKRYSLAMAFAITSDKDDDGNAASGLKSPVGTKKPKPKATPKKFEMTMAELTAKVEAGEIEREAAKQMLREGKIDTTKK